MKIAFITLTPLEFAGGFEKYLIKTAVALSGYAGVKVSILHFENRMFTAAVRKILELYYFKRIRLDISEKESTNKILQELGSVSYVKFHSISGFRSALANFELVYTKNEILDALILKYVVGYKTIPPVIFCCGTPIVYPDKALRSKLHNLLYNSAFYKYLTLEVRAFHVKNSNDERALNNLGLETFYSSNPIHKKGKLEHESKIFNIPIPLNLQSMRFGMADEFQLETRERFIILWTGRLTSQKGIDDLIDIINKINSSSYESKIFWVILGDGEERKKIEQVVISWKNVFYFGHVDHERVPHFIKNSNLFISTSKWESFGQNILEAQIMDVPAISYNIPGPNEIIVDGLTGYLVDSQMEMIDRIKRVVDKQVLFSDINKYIGEKFSPDIIYPQILTLFRKVVHDSKIH